MARKKRPAWQRALSNYAEGLGPLFIRILIILAFLAFVIPPLGMAFFAVVPVWTTPTLLVREMSGQGLVRVPVPLGTISPALIRAVIASEDTRFCQHKGFDWDAIDKASATNAEGGKLRGASTISQQTARTLFLVSARSWVRKGAEAYLTVLIEALWPKRRILTAYLNLVDWGHGNYGAEAASEAYFGKEASELSAPEAARLAAILPNPSVWRAVHPGHYVARRTGTLVARSHEVVRDALDECVR